MTDEQRTSRREEMQAAGKVISEREKKRKTIDDDDDDDDENTGRLRMRLRKQRAEQPEACRPQVCKRARGAVISYKWIG